MFALATTASLALSGAFWAWALHGGDPALDARTAARIFGWLCMASTGIGLFFALRDGTTYDRPGAPLVAALAVTLVTGCGVLYLSYFRWESALAVAAAAPAPASAAAVVAAEPPSAAPVAVASARVHARRTPGPAKRAGPCAALKRLAQHQCLKCSGESGLARFFCDESARAEYCAGRDGSEPGCPWSTASSTE